jgi:hypothetical protein
MLDTSYCRLGRLSAIAEPPEAAPGCHCWKRFLSYWARSSALAQRAASRPGTHRATGAVAARVILGDLYVLGDGLEVIMKIGRWPDRFDLQSMLDTWRGVREPFASAVDAWEWALVDGIFSNLHRLSLMVRLGESFSEDDHDVMADLLARIPRAQEVALTYATSERERDEIMTQLRPQPESRSP